MLVLQGVRDHLQTSDSTVDQSLIADHIVRVDVHSDHLAVELQEGPQTDTQPNGKAEHPDERGAERTVISIPWRKIPSKRRREVIAPTSVSGHDLRPIRAETRATLIRSIALGRRWLDELTTGAIVNAEEIAVREKCSLRQVNMTISLAFIAPNLVKAAIEGRLPRGIGVTRLRDAPAEWSRQSRMLGLTP
jgi:site-specific DNA recombinase